VKAVVALVAIALFGAGILLADRLAAHGAALQGTTETTTETSTTTIHETTTAPGTTVITTATAPQTTSSTSTSSASSSSKTPTWVWVVLAVLAAAVIALAVALLTRRGGTVSPAERQRRLDRAVATWATQGWALENQTADSAVLQRAGEQMVITVDPAGHVSAHPLTSQ
jgi:hypothetical protein